MKQVIPEKNTWVKYSTPHDGGAEYIAVCLPAFSLDLADISTTTEIWYRLSRRWSDFLIESSLNGVNFKQMRVFRLHSLGETSIEMGKLNPPERSKQPIQFGLYACSPLNSSFEAKFNSFKFDKCSWLAH